jgi:hypothetical protein
MKYVKAKAIIDDIETTVSILEGLLPQFQHASGFVDYEKYSNYISKRTTVPVTFVEYDEEGKAQPRVENILMSNELQMKFTDNGKFNDERYHNYIARCEALV